MFESIKDILLSLRRTSTERIGNPFYGVFILTWLAFNWEAIAILLFSDLKMDERVRFVNSAYPLIFFMPLVTSIILAFLLPYFTQLVTFFQSKPLSETSVLLASRRKKALVADRSIERYRAKKDVEYERYKTGAEKKVQDMKEEILVSVERTGMLTASLDEANEQIASYKIQLRDFKELEDRLKISLERITSLEDTLSITEEKYSNTSTKLGKREVEYAILSQEKDKLNKNFDTLKSSYPNLFINGENATEVVFRPNLREQLRNIKSQYNNEITSILTAPKSINNEINNSTTRDTMRLDEFLLSGDKTDSEKNEQG